MTDTESFSLDQKYLCLEYIYSPDYTIKENIIISLRLNGIGPKTDT